MNKCLITKLNGSSNNTELLRLGEMRMKIAKVESPTDATQGFSISVNKSVTLEIVGDGYFTDKNLTANNGKTLVLNIGENNIWVSNNDVEIAILDKYCISAFSVTYSGQSSTEYGYNKNLNIDSLKYSLQLNSLFLPSVQVSGDIASLKDITALTFLYLNNIQVYGDIANLKNLTALTFLYLPSTQVYGDIANLKNLTALTSLSLDNVQIHGDIGKLSGLIKCKNISLKNGTFTGDLSQIPSVCEFISFDNNNNTVFSWTNRPSTAKILAIEGNAKITNIDKMLQDQAQCQVGFTTSSPTWYKTISCVGTRTSASDAAVATLQQKGYTVLITPA